MNPKRSVREPLVEALAHSPMLQFLGHHERGGQELRAMLESGELRQFSAGAEIIRQGDTSDAMYLLVSGAVTVSLDGSEICIMEEPGDVFGEFGVMTGELRSASVTARDAVTCFRVDARFTSRTALQENTLFSRLLQQAVIKLLLGRIRKANEELVEAKRALDRAEGKAVFLKMDNEALAHELESMRRKRDEAFRGDAVR